MLYEHATATSLLSVLSWLIPSACAACGAGADARELLCSTCERAMPWLRAPLCRRCGLPLPCGSICPASRQAFHHAWAPLAHSGPARRLVVALKFRGALGVADAMGAQMAARAPARMLAGVALVPVPGDPWRRRTRGLDHAALLATSLGRHSGKPVLRALRRTGPAPRQSAQSRRVRTIGGRILVEPVMPAPAVVALIDDVHTTGATLDSCAAALISAGCSEVRALTFSRTLP